MTHQTDAEIAALEADIAEFRAHLPEWTARARELEAVNADLLEALRDTLAALDTALSIAPEAETTVEIAFKIVGAKEKANAAIAKATSDTR